LVASVQILHGIGPGNPWFRHVELRRSGGPLPSAMWGRNYLSGPGFFNLDAALSKSIRFTERYNVDLRLEAFGATNTPQFFLRR